MDRIKFGENIRNARKDLTRSELAELIGVSEKRLTGWEEGRQQPNLHLFMKLCEVLNVCPTELIKGV